MLCVSRTVRATNQSVLEEIKPEISLESQMTRLILWTHHVKGKIVRERDYAGKVEAK